MSRSAILGFARCLAVLALMGDVDGCAVTRYYWTRPSATAQEFDIDSRECTLQAAPRAPNTEYVVFRSEIYRECLIARGWFRAEQTAPPPAGWFRGLE